MSKPMNGAISILDPATESVPTPSTARSRACTYLFWFMVPCTVFAIVQFFILGFGWFGSNSPAAQRSSDFKRPKWEDRAGVARWLVHEASWAGFATLDNSTDGSTPYASVVSIADAAPGETSGRIFAYLSPLNEAGKDTVKRPSVSLLVTEASLEGGCVHDAEDPTCARITVVGDLVAVPDADLKTAEKAMFSRHPEMADWPTSHNFAFYEVAIRRVDVLNYYGGHKELTADDYTGATLVPSKSHHSRRLL